MLTDFFYYKRFDFLNQQRQIYIYIQRTIIDIKNQFALRRRKIYGLYGYDVLSM